MDEIKKRCPCDDCSGLEDVCPLKAVRLAIDRIREAASELPTQDGIAALYGAIQAAYDAMEE